MRCISLAVYTKYLTRPVRLNLPFCSGLATAKTFGCYTVTVRRKPIIWIVFALLAVLLAGPVFELFDHWDNIPETGNDTLLSGVLLLTFAGAIFAVRRVTVMARKLLYRLKHQSKAAWKSISSAHREPARFEIDSGPLPSLSSLRI